MTNLAITRAQIMAFRRTFEMCDVRAGTTVALLSETLSREPNVTIARLALEEIGADYFQIVAPSDPPGPIPTRSTGASYVLAGSEGILAALAKCAFIADMTIDGLLHAPEIGAILTAGSRAIYISDEHVETLQRCLPDERLKAEVERGLGILATGGQFRIASAAGTDLTVDLAGAMTGGNWGVATEPGTMAHWPGGLVACFPAAGTVNGTLVLDAGDINLTFKRYLTSRVVLRIEQDYVVDIDGDGFEAEMMRGHYDAWGEPAGFATSHVGWGMNPGARWDAFSMYDKAQTNGTEQRAFAGNLLYSTGANLFAGRETRCHFDLPVRGCTMHVDDVLIADAGRLNAELFPFASSGR
jgi:2,5-dihydroxypyridine 5,6-dioxygenase